MPATTQRLDVTLETALESVDLAENIVKRVAEAAGFSREETDKVAMAVREGVVNAYNYGNRHDARKKIGLVVEFDPCKMIVHVRDEGPGFDPAEIPDPIAEDNLLRTSGRGLFLIRSFMDEVAVRRRPGGGAELVMSKKLPHPLFGDNGSHPE